jgi:hypothetical protein
MLTCGSENKDPAGAILIAVNARAAGATQGVHAIMRSCRRRLMSRLVPIATAALLLVTAATAQVPEEVRPLASLPPDATTIANYYRQNVYDPADQKLGEIVDLPILKDGHVPAAIIAVGSFLGLAEKEVAVPFAALQLIPQSGKPRIVLDMSRKTLQTARGFQYNRATMQWEPAKDDD